MKRTITILLAVALLAFIGLGVTSVTRHNNKRQFQKVELQDTSAKLRLLEQKYDKELEQKNVDQQKLEQLQKEKDELAKQLSAKQEAKRVADAEAQRAAESLANAVTGTQTVYAAPARPSGPVSGCSGNPDADYIYMHESGCNPSAVNSIGCRGIGQACPGDKLPCGADFGCQHAYFTNYAVSRYGSWANARAFWQSHRWW